MSPWNPLNLPALCLYLPKFIYSAQLFTSTMHPKGEVEAPGCSASGRVLLHLPIPAFSPELCPGLCLQPSDPGTSHTYPKGARALHLHGVGLLEPPNLLDLVHQVPTIHVFHHKIQAILKEKNKQ